LGEEGFMNIVKTVQEATQKLIQGINAIPELEVLGEPSMCMFSFKSDVINVYQLADAMADRGWYIQGQFSTPLTPRNLHISVSYGTTHQVNALIKDLGECVEEVKQMDPIDREGIRMIVNAALQSAEPEAAFNQLAAGAGLTGNDLPEKMAFINEVMDALPDELCNVFLVNYFNDLYV